MPTFHQTYFSQPEEMPVLFVQAWMDRDAEALANLFAEDAEFVNVVGLWWHNREAIWKAHDYGLRKIFKDSVLELRQTRVKNISEEVAVVHARMKLSRQTPTAGVDKSGDRFNLFTFVVHKRSAGWLCVAAHNNDILQGMETHIRGEEGQIQAVDYRREPD